MKIGRLLLIGGLIPLAWAACTDKKPVVSMVWEMSGNDASDGTCSSLLTLTNGGEDTLGADWTLYYNQMSVAPIATDSEEVHVRQIAASYHSLSPTEHYKPIPPHGSRTFRLRHKGSIVRLSGAPQGAYIVIGDGKPCSVATTIAYSADGQAYRRTNDPYPYADGETVYAYNARFGQAVPLSGKEYALLPQPKQIDYTGGEVCLHTSCRIEAAAALANEAALLREELEEMGVRVCNEGKTGVRLVEADSLSANREGYVLRIDSTGICIGGRSAAGVFYGCRTLLQLYENQGTLPARIQAAVVRDYPDMGYRGQMLDIARNYVGKEELLKIIDCMASYKMNVLHLHLTDDEAWRIEIASLPELTSTGSRRGHTTDEQECLYPAYCGGWDPDDTGSTANGYLTREEYIELVDYARRRHIEIVPETDMPGMHAPPSNRWRHVIESI